MSNQNKSLLGMVSSLVSKQKNTIPIDECEKYRWTALQLICFNSDYDQLLKCKNLNIDNKTIEDQDINGNTSLHLLFRAFNDEDDAVAILKFLVPFITINSLSIKNDQRYTPLQEAEFYKSNKIIYLVNRLILNR